MLADQSFKFTAGQRIRLRAEYPNDVAGLIHESPAAQMLVLLERESVWHW